MLSFDRFKELDLKLARIVDGREGRGRDEAPQDDGRPRRRRHASDGGRHRRRATRRRNSRAGRSSSSRTSNRRRYAASSRRPCCWRPSGRAVSPSSAPTKSCFREPGSARAAGRAYRRGQRAHVSTSDGHPRPSQSQGVPQGQTRRDRAGAARRRRVHDQRGLRPRRPAANRSRSRRSTSSSGRPWACIRTTPRT